MSSIVLQYPKNPKVGPNWQAQWTERKNPNIFAKEMDVLFPAGETVVFESYA